MDDEPELIVTLRYKPDEQVNDFQIGGKLSPLIGPATGDYIARSLIAAIANAVRQHIADNQ